MKLTQEDYRTLRILSRSIQPMWPGVLERGGDPDLLRLMSAGLIEVWRKPFRIGKVSYKAGFGITDAGRTALSEAEGGK